MNSMFKNSRKAVWVLMSLCLTWTSITTGYGQNASNPILYTDVPDPDVIRVGNNYYMSSTTMHYNPGIPIMKSTDLANWEIVNYCYDIMDNNNALNLNNGQEAYSGGTWASSINYHEGRYYVSSFSYTTGRTYIYHTADIENGPWTKITINRVFHDHTLFFDDDGRVYMAYGHDNIQLTELRPDLTGVLPGGFDGVIIQNASSVAGTNFVLTAEGTRLQKINGTYYVSNICWPSGRGRTQILHKSNTLTGNYEGRVVFQSNNGSAQGEYTQTPDGKWYAMFFHDHGALGRIPDLMPVTWNNGWPTVGVNGQVPATVNIPGDNSLEGIIASDEFNNAGPLQLQWQWNHNPQNNYWSLSQRPGYLRLTNDRIDPNLQMTRNTLTQRSFGPKSTGYVQLDVSGMKNGDFAGLSAFQNDYGFVGVKMSGGNKSIVMAKGAGWVNNHTEIQSVPLNQNTVYLRVDFDFTNRVDDAFFYYSLDGNTWQQIGNKLDTRFLLEHFVGYRFALFSYGTQATGGYADFNFFRVGKSVNDIIYTGPSVSFSSPLSTDLLLDGENIQLVASASAPNATVTNVQFYNGNTLLATDNTAPYAYTWNNVAAGDYQLRAVVNDSQGKSAQTTLNIRVNIPQAPYQGNLHPIPGTIQLEEYDVGGNGNAYYDDTEGSETGVNYRTDEDVDIENCTDTGGGYNVGWATSGEWLEYSVDVTTPGIYELQIRAACNGTDRTVSVAMDGEDIATDVAIPNTTGWQAWQTVTVENIQLMPGEKIMRLTIGATDYVNLNYVTFNLVEEFVQEPYNGTPHAIPGRIEAEEYDLGREGLGYHEANENGNQGNATFRGDEVDIETTGDTDGEYNIAYTLTGEWLAYTVNVAQTGLYDIDLRVARDGANGSLHIEMDGNNITGAIAVPNTGAWQTYQTVTVNDINLTAGEHEMRIVFDTDYMNLNYVVFTEVVTDYDNDGTPTSEDCDDSNPQISSPITWFVDNDGDGLGSPDESITVCAFPDGYVSNANDLNDDDYDNDGISSGEDCDDHNPDISLAYTWYADTDADGVGEAANSLEACTKPTGYVATAGDECPNDINKTTPGNCGCGNTEESCLDCAGTPNGTAFLDNCDNCVATQQEACEQDCNGNWGGTAVIDACNECTGGNTGLPTVTDPTKCVATGMDNYHESDLKVYPNPTIDQVNLSQAVDWRLYNILGEQLATGRGKTINLSTYPRGMYLIKYDEGMIEVIKE